MVRKYYEKDTIERVLKHMKGVLSLRPVSVWLPSYIYAHIKICYISYAILSMMQYKIERRGISGVDALELMSKWYSVHLMDKKTGIDWTTNIELSKKQSEVRNMVYKTQ